MQIKKVKFRDVEKMAKLHLETLPDISSSIGLSAVTKLYKLIFNTPKIHSCFSAWEDGEFLGFVVISKNMDLTHKLFHEIFSIKNVIVLSFMIITFKVSFLRIVNRIFFEKKLTKIIGKNYCCISTICVNEKYQRKGIGKLLLIEALKDIQKLKNKRLYVYTRFDNKKALNFYNKFGFKKIGVFYSGVVFKYSL